MTDRQAELVIFIAPEVGIELSDVFDFSDALHVTFRRAKCTLRLGEYFFTLDIRHPCERDKDRIAAVVDYSVYHRFKFIGVKIYVGHLIIILSLVQHIPKLGTFQNLRSICCARSVEGLGIPQFLSLAGGAKRRLHAAGGRDRRAPRRAAAGVTGGHR